MRKHTVRVGIALWFWGTSLAALAASGQVVVDRAGRASETVRVGGRDVPLLRALEEIVPPSYSVNVPNAGAWADAPVSWQAGKPFVEVLRDLLEARPGLRAHVDTNLHLVTVTGRDTEPAAAAAYAPVSAPTPDVAAAVTVPDAASKLASVGPAATTIAPPKPTNTPENTVHRMNAAPQSVSAAPAPAPAPATVAMPMLRAQPPMMVAQVSAPVFTPTPQPHVTGAVPKPVERPVEPPVAGPPGLPLQVNEASSQKTVASASIGAGSLPVAPAEPQRDWNMRVTDGSVRAALERWAHDAGWQFIWDVPTDYSIDATAAIHGTFEQALHEVADALQGAPVPIQIVMYTGNRVLRVIPKGAV
ncbi:MULTISPECIES: toxin co-regulated pilus biosynthesis Q family protein [unclassified Paraburkholderia]|uniref:toxin co-regulated pilus biosynthesis Q family protein n=1 Tax=unclassified Paraburkholderia TaxID=2615204 RepID=UPI002AAF237F|nr:MULTISPECIES: toxin co-regulated pilus biosynthesis Q family protein [unclassified Paraburkholderia]